MSERLTDQDIGLTEGERAEQMRLCPCHGSDDYCPCGNVPDWRTKRARAALREQKDASHDR